MATKLDVFAAVNAGAQGRYWEPSGWPAWNAVGMVLERCPHRWLELTQDEGLGRVVQHMLMDCVETEKLPDEVLAACVPALVLPEWAELPMPGKSQRQRLRNIARRVAQHPRLQELATGTLHETTARCVKKGGLLHARKLRHLQPHEAVSLAHDLALTSNDANSLAKVCEVVAQLPRPTAVERPSAYDEHEAPTPKRLLSDDNRVSALAALACNPHLDRRQVTDLLDHLHPAEVQWLRTYVDAVPAWLKEAAVQHKATPAHQQEVPRVLTNAATTPAVSACCLAVGSSSGGQHEPGECPEGCEERGAAQMTNHADHVPAPDRRRIVAAWRVSPTRVRSRTGCRSRAS